MYIKQLHASLFFINLSIPDSCIMLHHRLASVFSHGLDDVLPFYHPWRPCVSSPSARVPYVLLFLGLFRISHWRTDTAVDVFRYIVGWHGHIKIVVSLFGLVGTSSVGVQCISVVPAEAIPGRVQFDELE